LIDTLKELTPTEINKLREFLKLIPNSQRTEIMTIRVAQQEYKSYTQNNLSEKTRKSVDTSFKHLIGFFGQHKILIDIGLRDVERFLAQVRLSAPAGYRVYFRTLKAAFNKFVDWGYISYNAFTKIKLPKQQQLKPVFIDKSQLNQISAYIKTNVVQYMTRLSFYTGLRLCECVNLKWESVDLNNKLLTVGDEQFNTKSRKQRVVPLCAEALEVLISAFIPEERRSEFVFCKMNGNPFTGDYISKRFKRACREAEMDERIHFHTLRHSFASNLVQRGVPLYSVKELLGHSSIVTTEIYSHLNLQSLREAVDKL